MSTPFRSGNYGVGEGDGDGDGDGVAAAQKRDDNTTFPGEVLDALESVQSPLVCIVL